jgi:hypothetical protein
VLNSKPVPLTIIAKKTYSTAPQKILPGKEKRDLSPGIELGPFQVNEITTPRNLVPSHGVTSLAS